jgi:hypothetical protein
VKCWFCKTQKRKRYCAPIDNVLCPVCCGENRIKKIDCIEECRYLEGLAYQKNRTEEKEFSELMTSVPHGEHDDIFRDMDVALMAGEIETFIRDIYVNRNILITDKSVYESYKRIYQIHVNNQIQEGNQLDELTQELLKLYESSIKVWEFNMERSRIGQVFLRLMISIKKMSGGRMGEFGYLNYLKNNLGNPDLGETYIVEDKFGNEPTPRAKARGFRPVARLA